MKAAARRLSRFRDMHIRGMRRAKGDARVIPAPASLCLQSGHLHQVNGERARMVVRIVVSSFALAFAGMAFAQDSAPQAQDLHAQDVQSQEARVVEGDTLLIERVQQENTSAMPARGMSMQEVEAKYGAPTSKLDPR